MIFLRNDTQEFEEEDEGEGALNDALLDELVDEIDDDELIEGLEPVPPVAVVEEDLDAEEGEDATARAFFEGEDEDSEDGDLDYDSFDDKDDL